ncbi:MAG: hypothetical protein LAT63_07520 [Marinobacter sp.]|nr:hypothetical protein [Marinobacter sp.]
MKSYELVRPDNVPPCFKVVLDVPDLDDPRSRRVFYKDDNCLIVYRSSYGDSQKDLTENQIEIPISSLSWVLDSIENGFWKNPSEGGFPKNKHGVSRVFDEEEILVVRSMNAGSDKPGFKIVNKSRSSHIIDAWPQNFVFTDDFAVTYIFPIFSSVLGISD